MNESYDQLMHRWMVYILKNAFSFLALLVMPFLFGVEAGAQTMDAHPWLDAGDSILLHRADSLEAIAGRYEAQNDSLRATYQEIKNNPSSPAGADTLRKLERKADQAHLKALEQHVRSNALLYRINRKHLKELENMKFRHAGDHRIMKAQLLNEEALDLLTAADSLRKKPSGIPGKSTYQTAHLENALKKEEKGLQKMDEALKLFHTFLKGLEAPGADRNANPSGEKTKKVKVDKALMSQVRMNLDELDPNSETYRRLSELNLNDTISFALVRDLKDGLESRDESEKEGSAPVENPITAERTEEMEVGMKGEQEGRQKVEQEETTGGETREEPEKSKGSGNQKDVAGKETSGKKNRAQRKEVKTSRQKSSDKAYSREPGRELDNRVSKSAFAFHDSKHLIFRVQIAASRVPLSRSKLKKIYPGVKTIISHRGEGWYRYSIGYCPTYRHADSLRKSIRVPGTFVVAYLNDQRLNAWNYRDIVKECPPVRVVEGLQDSSGIIFRVQIAASRQMLSEKRLGEIYCGSYPVAVSWEEAYYKYLIGSFTNYARADDLTRRTCVPGAFVVAYLNGRRIKLSQALGQK